MLVAFLLMISPIRGLAHLGAVARHATPTTNQVTRLGEVRRIGTEVAQTPPESTPMRPNSWPTRHGRRMADGACRQNDILHEKPDLIRVITDISLDNTYS